MSKTYWKTQEVLFATRLFGKDYVWLKDVDGTIYLLPLDEDGQPVL